MTDPNINPQSGEAFDQADIEKNKTMAGLAYLLFPAAGYLSGFAFRQVPCQPGAVIAHFRYWWKHYLDHNSGPGLDTTALFRHFLLCINNHGTG